METKTIFMVFSVGNLWRDEQDQDHLAAEINMIHQKKTYATIHTILMLTQDISVVVIGTERRTIITLDLYNTVEPHY